jgi:hypothetical protein
VNSWGGGDLAKLEFQGGMKMNAGYEDRFGSRNSSEVELRWSGELGTLGFAFQH